MRTGNSECNAEEGLSREGSTEKNRVSTDTLFFYCSFGMIFFTFFSNFALGSMTMCPQPQHLMRKSIPVLRISHWAEPQGWLFFICTISPTEKSIPCTNRAFVFRSKTQGKAMAREFGAFVTCRLGTMLLDTAMMLVLGNLLAAQGAALMDELMQGVLSVVAHWLGPDTAIQMAASYAGTPAGVTDGSAAIAVIGGADGPTAIFVTSRYNAQALWGLAVKIFSNVLVIVLNYVFSKLIIFKKK